MRGGSVIIPVCVKRSKYPAANPMSRLGSRTMPGQFAFKLVDAAQQIQGQRQALGVEFEIVAQTTGRAGDGNAVCMKKILVALLARWLDGAGLDQVEQFVLGQAEIGRAAWRERGCKYV